MIEWERYLPFVMPSVEGCPIPMAVSAIRNGARRLCTDTLLWSQTLDPIYPVATVSTYELELPQGAEAVVAVAGTYDGDDIDPTTRDKVEALANWMTETGTPKRFYLPSPSTVRLHPIPAAAPVTPLVIEARLKPSLTSYEAPDFLFDYAEIIALWAKHELQDMTGRPWHNSQDAAKHRMKYNAEINEHLLRAKRGRTSAANTVRPRKFA